MASRVEDERAEDDGPSTSETCGYRPNQETSEESACLEDTDAIRINVGRFRFRVTEIILKRSECEDSPNDTGIIGEEE